MMKRLFQSLRKLFIVALVGMFISVGTFTQKAAAYPAKSTQANKENCPTLPTSGQNFRNLPFAYADKGPITLEAKLDQFQLGDSTNQPNSYLYQAIYANKSLITSNTLPASLEFKGSDEGNSKPSQSGSSTKYNGYLYDATYYNADGNPESTGPAYTPPTIVVSPGNSIDLTLTNNLPPKVELTGQIPKTEENIQKQSQDTNLHYHGFNVSPLLGSDDVVMHVHSKKTPYPALSSRRDPFDDNGDIYPDDSPRFPKYGSIAEYRMRVNLPKGHQSGLFWYHPHAHTVSDNQVLAGMSGGIIVNGIEESYRLLDPKDGIKLNLLDTKDDGATSDKETNPSKFNQPSRLSITQQVMLFKDFNDVLGTRSYNCVTLNGQIQPRININSGEVQLWRIGNIGADTYLNLKLEPSKGTIVPLKFYILARDGNVVNKPIKTKSILVPPASRVELLIVGGSPMRKEEYWLTSKPDAKYAPNAYDGNVALVTVGGQKVTYRCPDGSPLKSCTPDLIESTSDQSKSTPKKSGSNSDQSEIVKYITSQKAAIIDDILPDPEELADYKECKDGDDHTKCITPGNEYSDPFTQKRIFEFNSKQLGKNFVFTINDKLYNENRIDKVSHLGDIEEWQVDNKTGAPHAFHMHQLDFLVTKVTLPDNPGSTYDNYNIVGGKCDGEKPPYTCDLEPQGYRDTINLPPNSTTTIRIPFLNPFITGVFVYHCHILGHEDSGMMQNLKVIDPKNYKSTSGLVSNS